MKNLKESVMSELDASIPEKIKEFVDISKGKEMSFEELFSFCKKKGLSYSEDSKKDQVKNELSSNEPWVMIYSLKDPSKIYGIYKKSENEDVIVLMFDKVLERDNLTESRKNFKSFLNESLSEAGTIDETESDDFGDSWKSLKGEYFITMPGVDQDIENKGTIIGLEGSDIAKMVKVLKLIVDDPTEKTFIIHANTPNSIIIFNNKTDFKNFISNKGVESEENI